MFTVAISSSTPVTPKTKRGQGHHRGACGMGVENRRGRADGDNPPAVGGRGGLRHRGHHHLKVLLHAFRSGTWSEARDHFQHAEPGVIHIRPWLPVQRQVDVDVGRLNPDE
jgi:hypothetical protein